MGAGQPILVLGAGGQVGRALLALLRDKAVGAAREEADFSNPACFEPLLERINPCAIVNAAAYTQVDKAEEEEALAHQINAHSPGVLARLAAARGIPLVHYSTDYVFAGKGKAAQRESDVTAPLNAYGRSKLAGEQAVADAGGKHLIFRTSWVFDGVGKNFLTTMLRLGRERQELRVVADQVGAPSYAPHLASATLDALVEASHMTPFPSGIYHMCAAGQTSWHGFACEIFAQARARGMELAVRECTPIGTKDYPLPAKRPYNSRLSCDKLAETYGVTLPDWREGVAAALQQAQESTRQP